MNLKITHLLSVLGLATVFAHFSANAQVIPASRRVDYSRVGVVGVVPNPPTVLNITSYGAVGDSNTNCVTAFNAAISALGGQPGVIYFPAGKFRFNSGITLPAGVVLRGAGPASTSLIFNLGASGASNITVTQSNSGAFAGITSGYSKGSTSIVVTGSTVGINPGDFIQIQQTNIWETRPTATPWAVKTVGQILQVASVNGNTINLVEPIRINFRASQSPEYRRVNMVQHVGIENLRMRRMADAAGVPYGVYFEFAANCWIRGVESFKSASAHVGVVKSTNLDISGNYMHDGYVFTGSGTRGYGVMLGTHTGSCKIENNVFRYLRHSISIKEGANGNVASYNYSTQPFRSEFPSDAGSDFMLHGWWASGNLLEGNIGTFLQHTAYWGPSGPYNTFFRNRTTLYGLIISEDSTGVGTSKMKSDSQNVVGNEVIGTGFSPICGFCPLGNYLIAGSNHILAGNNVNGTINPTGTGTVSEKSYYLSAQPSWWNIASPWGGIGPGNTLGANTIPSKYRWDNNQTLPVPYTPPAKGSLNVTGVQNISGDYTNVTINNQAVMVMTQDVYVSGTFTLKAGGTLVMGTRSIRGAGNFVMEPGATLVLGSAQGIATGTTTGNIRNSGTRTFPTSGNYHFRGTAAQVTGNGFPAQAQTMVLNGFNVTLSQALLVHQHVLLLGAGNLVSAGFLTLNSDASRQGQVVMASTGQVTGIANVRRYVGGLNNAGPRHYSSPVASTTIADFIGTGTMGSNVVQWWRETAPVSGVGSNWVTISRTDSLFRLGRGYSWNSPFGTVAEVTGTLNNGATNVRLYRTGTSGWNLTGNPYASTMDWNAVVNDVAYPSVTNLSKARFQWVSRGAAIGYWGSYVNGIPADRRYVPVMQGFLLRAYTNNTVLTFTNAHRVGVTGINPMFRRSAAEDMRPQLMMYLNQNNDVYDEAGVYFQQEASSIHNAEYDAEKINIEATDAKLAVVLNNMDFSIKGLPHYNTQTIVPLSVKTATAGAASISFTSNFFTEPVYLHDAVEGVTVDIRQNPVYQFNSNGVLTNNRFSLMFQPLATVGVKSSLSSLKLSVYPNPATLNSDITFIPSDVNSDEAFSIKIYNNEGKLMLSEQVSVNDEGKLVLKQPKLNTGFYTYSVELNGAKQVGKLVVE